MGNRRPKPFSNEYPGGIGRELKAAEALIAQFRAGIEQMEAHENAGGSGWWKGWAMLKAAYSQTRIQDR